MALVISSLSNLADKFFEREELDNYQFQKEFLKPYEVIINQSRLPENRIALLNCLTRVITSHAQNIKSGWTSIFAICAASSLEDSEEKVILTGFHVVQQAMVSFHSTQPFFVDCVTCLLAFALNPLSQPTSLQAIEFLSFCAKQLSEGHVSLVQSPFSSFRPVFGIGYRPHSTSTVVGSGESITSRPTSPIVIRGSSDTYAVLMARLEGDKGVLHSGLSGIGLGGAGVGGHHSIKNAMELRGPTPDELLPSPSSRPAAGATGAASFLRS